MPTNPNIKLANIVQYVEATTELLTRLQNEKAAMSKQADDAKALIPDVVTGLVQSGAIRSDEVKAASDALADPAKTLHLLKRAAALLGKMNQEKAASLGRPSGEFDGSPVARGGLVVGAAGNPSAAADNFAQIMLAHAPATGR